MYVDMGNFLLVRVPDRQQNKRDTVVLTVSLVNGSFTRYTYNNTRASRTYWRITMFMKDRQF